MIPTISMASRSTALPQVQFKPIPAIDAYRAGIDVSLIRERLKRSPEERLMDCDAISADLVELRRAGARARAETRRLRSQAPEQP